MSKSLRPHPLTVCLLSAHPGLLATFQRLLSGPEFKLKPVRLKLGPGQALDDMQLPHSAVHIVDASLARPTIEHLIETIRERIPKARVLVVKETLKDERLFPYLRLGAKGAVRYLDVRHDLARAVQVIASGGYWISRSQFARFVDWVTANPQAPASLDEPGHLSRREREALVAILQGLSNKEIAAQLHITERTVKFHVSNLLAKFGAQRRADLILKHYQLWPAAS